VDGFRVGFETSYASHRCIRTLARNVLAPSPRSETPQSSARTRGTAANPLAAMHRLPFVHDWGKVTQALDAIRVQPKVVESRGRIILSGRDRDFVPTSGRIDPRSLARKHLPARQTGRRDISQSNVRLVHILEGSRSILRGFC
jgi:hypothetical protein